MAKLEVFYCLMYTFAYFSLYVLVILFIHYEIFLDVFYERFFRVLKEKVQALAYGYLYDKSTCIKFETKMRKL